MSNKGKKAANDPTRFEGSGISYKAKLIGIEDVPEARGDQMCQEAITKLKNSVKISGQHKQKIFVNVTLEGLKMIDAISLASNQNKKKNETKIAKPGEDGEQPDKEQELVVLHTHAVHRISFISRDTTDNRAFGYVYGDEEGKHQFFAIKTASAAEQLVLALRDLFQVVYDMKKKEMEEAKEKIEKGDLTQAESEENSKTSGDGSTSGTGQTPQTKANADTENIYQVPTNNAPVNPETKAEQVANLLDLEDQADHILKGIEQIKNLEFDSLDESAASPLSSPPTSPMAKLAPPSSSSSGTADPWGLSSVSSPTTTAPAATTGSSALGDLAGLQTSSFPTMGQQPHMGQPNMGQQAMFGAPFAMQSGYGAPAGFNPMSGGLPVTKDPFGNDPFNANSQHPGMQPPGGGFGAANPFGAGFGQPFGMQQGPGMQQGAGVQRMMPGMVPHGMMSSPVTPRSNPFGGQAQANPQPQMGNAFGDDNQNVLQPMKQAGEADPTADAAKSAQKSSRDDLFGDLVGLKSSASPTAKTPKDLFAQKNAVEKKSLNDMKASTQPASTAAAPAQASDAVSDPFGDFDSIGADKTRGLLSSGCVEEDPFDVSHIPPSLAEPPNPSTHSSQSFPVSTIAPPVPQRRPSPNNIKDTLPSTHMPSESPPPLPSSFPTSFPPVPSRNTSQSTETKVVEGKSLSHPSGLVLSSSPPVNNSFMLPSPDEPPPPLPTHLSSSSIAPAPPPRPNIKSTTSSSKSSLTQSTQHNGIEQTNLSLSSQSSHRTTEDRSLFKDNFESLKHSVSETVSNSDEFDAKFDSLVLRSQSDPFAPIDSNFKTNNQCDKNIWKNEVNANFPASDFGFSNEDPFSDKFDFNKCDTVAEKKVDASPTSSENKEDTDPFIMPFHLTPGFKAVAKFGNDPFDDSFGGLSSNKNDKWDPFGVDGKDESHDGSSSSPFDAFGAPPQPQPVNGNNTNKPLLD